MKNYIYKTFIAHLCGFLALILTHLLWSLSTNGNASSGDTGIIIFWAAIFLILFYLVFVIIPKKLLENIARKTNIYIFSLGFAFYALLAFILMIGWIFLNSNFKGVFLDAFFYGLTFGTVFYQLENQNKKLKVKDFALLFSLPIIAFFIYILILPKLFPSFAFKIVPKQSKEQILKETISKFKKGDDFNDLKNALPGYFVNIGCDFSTGALMEDFQYSLVVENCRITKIESGPRKNNRGITEMVVETPLKKE